MTARWPVWTAALVLLPGIAAAADFGTLTVEGKRMALTSACAYSPRFDTQGWGKPEAILLLSDKPIDCPAATGWVTPDNGAFEQVVRKGRGAAGEKLPGGGDPGKAYLAYLKAYQDGDYAALQKLRPEGKAEEDWGYHSDPAERKTAIQGENKAKSAKILDAWKNGQDATLIVEVSHPFNPSEKTKAVVGLWFDGTGWRVREERMDFGGTMLGS